MTTRRLTVRPRLVIIGPLPPPFGGVQLMIDMQRRSILSDEFELSIVDTSKRRLRCAVDRPTWRTPLYFLRDLARVVHMLLLLRPELALVHAAGGLSFLRDCAFVTTARLLGAKVICHYHGTVHARFPSCETRSGRVAGRLLLATAHRVVVLGPSYQRAMGKAWRRRDVVWAPNTADVALYRNPPDGRRPAWLSPGERGVLFVGRLSEAKGIYELLAAIPRVLAHHPSTRLVLVGVAESEAMERALHARSAGLRIASQVTFLGALDGAPKAEAFMASDLLVVPSWTEAFPLVIPEAMAAGLPVVASAVGAIPDFVHDGEDGFLVAAKDPAALADRICRLLGDEDLRRRIAERVRARAPREFGIDVGASRIAAVARTLLRSEDSPAIDAGAGL